MLQYLDSAAVGVGINVKYLNSKESVDTQLNRLTREEDLPTMLISWDIDTSLTFDQNGVLRNPSANIVALLVIKPETMSDTDIQNAVEQMAVVFTQFIQLLNSDLNTRVKSDGESPITNATFKRAPNYGAGKHAGVLGTWTMLTPRETC